jgi:membrane protease YdiL (CAAX protease family)
VYARGFRHPQLFSPALGDNHRQMPGDKLVTPPAIGVALLAMLVAALENTIAPWAPFYVVYAALALCIPLLLRESGLRNLRRPPLRYWLIACGLAVALQALFRLMTTGADLPGMFGRVFTVAGGRLAAKPETLAKWYVIFVQIWAGLGEEVFYRGYLQRNLRRRFGPLVSIGVASLMFASRHYTQVLIVWPRVDWGPATIWVAGAFVVGVAWGALYERSGSLWPSIVCHYLFNILG